MYGLPMALTTIQNHQMKDMLIRKKKVFWIDLPDPQATKDDSAWIHVATFNTRRQAVKFLNNRYGIEEKYADLFIRKEEEMNCEFTGCNKEALRKGLCEEHLVDFYKEEDRKAEIEVSITEQYDAIYCQEGCD
jgi:hypothetical protein